MKQALMRMVLVAGLAGVGVAKAEMAYVVEISDVSKKVTREIKTSAELSELKKTIDAEARVFPKALELTKKEWETADKGAPPAEKPKAGEKVAPPAPAQPFPSNMLAARKYSVKGPFDQVKAQKMLEQLGKSDADAIEKAAAKAKALKPTDKDKAKMARDADRAQAADKAALAVQAKIDDLIRNPPGSAAASSNAAPAADAAPAAQ